MNFSYSADTTLKITDWVLAEVADMLRTTYAREPGRPCFRLTVDKSDQPQLSIDGVRPDDHEFAYEGRTVLVVAPELAQRFKGRTLDLNAAGDFLLI